MFLYVNQFLPIIFPFSLFLNSEIIFYTKKFLLFIP